MVNIDSRKMNVFNSIETYVCTEWSPHADSNIRAHLCDAWANDYIFTHSKSILTKHLQKDPPPRHMLIHQHNRKPTWNAASHWCEHIRLVFALSKFYLLFYEWFLQTHIPMSVCLWISLVFCALSGIFLKGNRQRSVYCIYPHIAHNHQSTINKQIQFGEYKRIDMISSNHFAFELTLNMILCFGTMWYLQVIPLKSQYNFDCRPFMSW